MAQLFDPHFQAVDAAGVPISGANLYFYLAATTTPITVYQDAGATTPHTNPVIADSSGLFPPIYGNSGSFKTVLKTSSGVTIQTVDNQWFGLQGGVVGDDNVDPTSDLYMAVTHLVDDVPPIHVVGVYSADGTQGLAENVIVSETEASMNKERHSFFVGNYTSGTGDGTVPASTYAIGASIIKADWETTTRKGQMHGISVVTRGGFHGTDDEPGSGNPGDTAAIVTNSVVSSGQSFVCGIEGVAAWADEGAFVPGSVKNIRYQVAGICHDDGIAHGYLAVATAGALSAAFQAGNELGGASGDGFWENFLKYVPNLGAGYYEAFKVNQAGHIVLNNGPGAATPNREKSIRVGATGDLEIINSAGSAIILSLGDGGSLGLPAGQVHSIGGNQVLGPRRTGWTAATGTATRTTFATGSVTLPQLAERVKALLDDLMAHGMIGA